MPTTYTTVKVPVPYYSRSSDKSPWAYQNTIVREWTKSSKDAPLPSTRAKPSDLWMAQTARTVRTEKSSVTNINAQTYYDKYESYPLSYLFYSGVSGKKSPSIDRAAMYNKIRASIRQDGVNLAMALGEYRQTAQLFGDLAKAVSSHGKSLVRGIKGVKSGSAVVAKQHLAFQYGVKPLCSDLVDSYNNLREAANKSGILQGVQRKHASISGTTLNISSNSPSLITGKAYADWTETLEYKTKWRAILNKNVVAGALARHGFVNPFSLAYELTPYSFVLDWWLNVGEVLSSLDNLVLVDALYVADSSRLTSFERITYPGNSSGSYQSTPGTNTRIQIVDTRMGVSSISSIATLKYKKSTSLTHILNGMALIRLGKRG